MQFQIASGWRQSRWNFRDFFNLNSADEHVLKKALAMHLKTRYDSIGMGEPVANAVDGIPPYKPDDMKKHTQKY